MVTNDRRITTYSDYIKRFVDNPRIWIDEDLWGDEIDKYLFVHKSFKIRWNLTC